MRKWLSPTMCAGLELEYEDVSVAQSADTAAKLFPDGHLLDFKKDGSLRPRDRSTEIVFAFPLSGKKIDEALNQLEELILTLPYTISWRCGMHTHIDCRGMGWDAAYRGFVLSSMIEPILYAWDGTGRKENKFCQSIVDSVGAFTPKSGRVQFTKYSLVNALSLGHLGSLELRFAAATKDIDRMADYINLGMAIRLCGETFPSSELMIESMMMARSMPDWLIRNIPGQIGVRLARIADQIGYTFPASSTLFASIALAQREPTLRGAIVGGGKGRNARVRMQEREVLDGRPRFIVDEIRDFPEPAVRDDDEDIEEFNQFLEAEGVRLREQAMREELQARVEQVAARIQIQPRDGNPEILQAQAEPGQLVDIDAPWHNLRFNPERRR